VIAAAALGDIMQQRGNIEHAARGDLADDLCGERVLLGFLALFDAGKQADGADGVLVHRVVMVHIELHLRDDAAEIRHEAAKNPGLAHPTQRIFGVVAAASAVPERACWRAGPCARRHL